MRNIFESDMLYTEEHFKCPRYVRDAAFGFKYKEHPQGFYYTSESLRANVIVFLLQGTLRYDRGTDGMHTMEAGNMLFLPVKSMCDLEFSDNTSIIYVAFERSNFVCESMPLQVVNKLVEQFDSNSTNELQINRPLKAFLDLLITYLRNGVNCGSFHMLKIDELFILIRHFYSKEQIAGFLAPILGPSQEFRSMCLRLRAETHNITEMVDRSGMSKTKFYAKFRDEFGDINPKKWFDSYMEFKILHAASRAEATVKDLAYKFDFESESAFSQYCHRHFGQTASELIKNRHKGKE
jgi:AraC-like DNA-binding protein